MRLKISRKKPNDYKSRPICFTKSRYTNKKKRLKMISVELDTRKHITNIWQIGFEASFFQKSFETLLAYPIELQYIPRNMHTVFALLCFVVVIHWLIFPYPSGLLHWHCGNLTIAPVPAKQPWWIWINTSCKFIMNDCITTTKQSTTKPCAYFLGYTVQQTYMAHVTQNIP